MKENPNAGGGIVWHVIIRGRQGMEAH